MTDADAGVTFECDLDAPPEKVWRALAEPALRAAWLGETEERACEAIELAPEAGRVTLRWRLDQPASLVTFEIDETVSGGTHLTITHEPAVASVVPFTPRPARTQMSAGGWRMAA
ncbi:MAG TPA: SRPBCC domain-containing protein [Caulobacteraceae bacterium]